MSTIKNDRKFASPVKKEGKAIENVGAELGEGELKQVVGGSLSINFAKVEFKYTEMK